MDATFKKLKNKFLIYSLIKSLICAVSAGLFAVGAVWLSLKLAGVPIHGGYYALIGAGVACVCFGIVFPLLLPNDLKVARKLDKDYALRERVETMVAYKDDGGDMAQLQREDASLKLENLPKKKPDFKKLWQYILIPVVAVAFFLSAALVKDRYPYEGEVPPEDYAVTGFQLDSLKEIIASFEDEECELSDETKQKVVGILEGFYSSLELGIPENIFETVFLTTVQSVDDAFKTKDNSYFAICNQLVTSETLEPLSDTIENSIKAFKGIVSVNSYDGVKARAKDLEADIDSICRLYLIDSEESLLNHYKTIPQTEGLMTKLNEYKDELDGLLQKSGADPSDGLYSSLSGFVSGIARTTELEGRTDNYVYTMLQSYAFNPLANGLPYYLYLQSYDYLFDEYVRERLSALFSIAVPPVNLDIEKHSGSTEEPDPDEKGDGNSGGMGGGNMNYGSDDIIYDPEKGYVSYGEVINDYYSRVQGQIIEGNIPEDIANILTKYFDMLMSGIEQKDDDKNN